MINPKFYRNILKKINKKNTLPTSIFSPCGRPSCVGWCWRSVCRRGRRWSSAWDGSSGCARSGDFCHNYTKFKLYYLFFEQRNLSLIFFSVPLKWQAIEKNNVCFATMFFRIFKNVNKGKKWKDNHFAIRNPFGATFFKELVSLILLEAFSKRYMRAPTFWMWCMSRSRIEWSWGAARSSLWRPARTSHLD